MNKERSFIARTGERLVLFGNDNQGMIQVVGQVDENDCGQACLKMLGFNQDLPKDPVNPFDVSYLYNGEDIGVKEVGTLSPDIPFMVLGMKRDTRNNHWFILVGETVINPEGGGQILDKVDYLKNGISTVLEVWKVPFARGSGHSNPGNSNTPRPS